MHGPGSIRETSSCVRHNNADAVFVVGTSRSNMANPIIGPPDTIFAGSCTNPPKKFIAAIRRLNARMNIPNNIQGIRKEDISEMAKYAEREANPLYPVPKLMTRKELEGIYYKIAERGVIVIDRAGYAESA